MQRAGEAGDGAGLVIGGRVPAMESRKEPGGGTARWRSPAQGALVAVVLDRGDEAAGDYLRSLDAVASELQAWSGRLFLVAPTREAARVLPAPSGARVAVMADPTGEIRRRIGVPEGGMAVIVADRWGVVYHVTQSESPAALPRADDLVAWLRYLATQCPECGVPDEPGLGEWGREWKA